jgi:hypothetical protein
MPLIELINKESATLLSLPEFVALDSQSIRIVHLSRRRARIPQIQEARAAPLR